MRVPGAEATSTTARITSTGRRNWFSANETLWPGARGSWRAKLTRCALRNFCCFARRSAQATRAFQRRPSNRRSAFLSPRIPSMFGQTGSCSCSDEHRTSTFRCRGTSRLFQRPQGQRGKSRLPTGSPSRDGLSLGDRPDPVLCWPTWMPIRLDHSAASGRVACFLRERPRPSPEKGTGSARCL